MKLAHAFANLLLLLAPASARPEADEDNTTPSLRATSNRKLNDSLLAAHDVTPIDHQGRVLLTNDHRALGGQKIDISDSLTLPRPKVGVKPSSNPSLQARKHSSPRKVLV